MTRFIILMCVCTSGCILKRERHGGELQFNWVDENPYDCPHARDIHEERCETGGGSHADEETVP